MSVEKIYAPDGETVRGYKVRWRDTAGKSRRKTVTRWRDAVALDGEKKRQKAMGELITHERGSITLNEFWELWWTNYATPHLTTKTRTVHATLFGTHLQPALGRSKLTSIGRETCSVLTSTLSTTLAPSTVRQLLAILQGVMERGVEWGYLNRNPVKGVRRPRLVTREGRALTETELAALVAELPELRSQTIVRLLTGTGMRPGELRALDWSATGSSIRVTKAVSSNEIGPTKTNRLRSVEPTADARAALREWNLASGRPDARDLVFPAPSGGLWTDLGWQMWRQRVFVPAAARAGLTGLRPYDLRHTFASTRIAEGADILTLARELGHSPTMTLTVYGHQLGGESVPSECPTNAETG